MTPIAELWELHAKATPGPWEVAALSEALRRLIQAQIDDGRGDIALIAAAFDGQHKHDAALIVAAHTHLPSLLDEIDRLTGERDAARKLCDDYQSGWEAQRDAALAAEQRCADIIEQCATVAENQYRNSDSLSRDAGINIAAALRALAQTGRG